MNINQLLKHISTIIDLSEDESNYLASLLNQKHFKKRAFVLLTGDVCKYQTFVLNGCLKIFYVDPEGYEHIVKFALEDWWAFDIESFITGCPAFYSIQAIENTETLQLSKEKYDELLDSIPGFEKYYRTMLQNSYIMLQHRLTQNLYSNAEDKYIRFKEKYPGLEQRISQKDVASYLGITPEFLSMMHKKSRVTANS